LAALDFVERAMGGHTYQCRFPFFTVFDAAQNKAKQIRIFTKEFTTALILILLFVLGTYFEIPPFSTFLGIGDSIKDAATKKYGEPPYGHAELSSIKTFAKKMDIDLKTGISLLKQSGYQVDNDTQTLKEIGRINGVSPKKIHMAMSPAAKKSSVFSGKAQSLPESPAPGTGNLTLADFCSQYNLNINIIMRSLKESHMVSKPDMTIKEIGEKNKMGPIDVYEQIKTIADKTGDN
jgi:hypothetical protein